ncbi:hypothetical protein ABXN37_19820 [Piscinibacter sakaiensis]|nr:hypothetical protein [Piscinibacter sakaiensis]
MLDALIAACRNPDGTYNGIELLARLSGTDRAEVAWMARRIGELIRAGTPKDEAKSIVRREAAARPWHVERPTANRPGP